MSNQVIVYFGGARQYQFHVRESDVDAVTPTEAHRWLDDQWSALGCEPVRPSGKVLVLDKVLGIAREAGEQRFAQDDAWARAFARNVALLVARPVVVVDVPENRVG